MLLLLKLLQDYLKNNIDIEEIEKNFEILDKEFYEHIINQDTLMLKNKKGEEYEVETSAFNRCVQKTFYGYRVNYSCVFATIFELKLKKEKEYLANIKERQEFEENLRALSFYLQDLANKKEEERINNYFKKIDELKTDVENNANDIKGPEKE